MKPHKWLFDYSNDFPRAGVSWEPLLLLINNRRNFKDKLSEISKLSSYALNKILSQKLNNPSKFCQDEKAIKLKVSISELGAISIYASDTNIDYNFDAIAEKNALYISLVYSIRKVYNIQDPFYFDKRILLGNIEYLLHDDFGAILDEICDNKQEDRIHVLVGDITTVNTDVIVNTANYRLLGGGGVDGAIHKAGGNKILEECKILRDTKYQNGLPVGEAVITNAGNLKASYIIHTVGPKFQFDDNPQCSLESCYTNSFLLAEQHKCSSIAFPSISTGVYGYPKEEANKIAYSIIRNLLLTATSIENVIFVFYSHEDAEIFKSVNSIN